MSPINSKDKLSLFLCVPEETTNVTVKSLSYVIILKTISKRQDGLGFIGKNGYIFHDSSRCIEVLIGGAYTHMFEDLLQVISYNIPLFSLIQMLKFVLHILNLK